MRCISCLVTTIYDDCRMLDIFSQFSGFLKFDKVCIDNNVFRLHYKATVMVLVCASVLVTSRQYIGDPIDCMVDVSKISSKSSVRKAE